MSELLLELFCEEIPAKMQKNAETAYHDIFARYFSRHEIASREIRVYITPCRIAIHATGLPLQMPEKLVELKGPKVGAPLAAIEGFCRSNNITQDQLTVRNIKEAEFYVYVSKLEAKGTRSILMQSLAEPLAEYVWPKSMYWGDYKIKWVRPLKNILCIFDGEVVPFRYGHLEANDHTFGHKFMAPEIIEGIKNFDEYRLALEKQFVILSRTSREEYIKKELEKAADNLKLVIKDDQMLIEEVAGLVEYPVIMAGKINPKFLSVPAEVLVTSMRSNQRYFSLFDRDGNFAPCFLFVSNIASTSPELVIAGNEKVLSARLSDALFFYNQDLKMTLAERAAGLDQVMFHKSVGSLGLKQKMVAEICSHISPNDTAARMAASLYKSDILSEVVGEFPTLQGIIGYYYAKAESLDDEIATAIRDHYKPNGPSDTVPAGSAATLALADKLYDLISLTHAGERATGSRDPYALRRLALGIIRIIIHNKINLNLPRVIEYFSSKIFAISEETGNYILSFTSERAKYFFREDYDISLVNAVLDLQSQPDLYATHLKLVALKEFLATDSGDDLLVSYKRANNITGQKKLQGEVDESLFETEYERNLYRCLIDNSVKVKQAAGQSDYRSALELLGSMRRPIAEFFDRVMVNHPDQAIANNRLLLLEKITQIFNNIARFDLL